MMMTQTLPSEPPATVLSFQRGMQVLRSAAVNRATQARLHNRIAKSLTKTHRHPEEPTCA